MTWHTAECKIRENIWRVSHFLLTHTQSCTYPCYNIVFVSRKTPTATLLTNRYTMFLVLKQPFEFSAFWPTNKVAIAGKPSHDSRAGCQTHLVATAEGRAWVCSAALSTHSKNTSECVHDITRGGGGVGVSGALIHEPQDFSGINFKRV